MRMWGRKNREWQRGCDNLGSFWQQYCSIASTGSPAEGPWHWLCTLRYSCLKQNCGIYLYPNTEIILQIHSFKRKEEKQKHLVSELHSLTKVPYLTCRMLKDSYRSLIKMQTTHGNGRYFSAQNDISRQGHAAWEESGNLDCTSLAAAQNDKEGWGKTDSINLLPLIC